MWFNIQKSSFQKLRRYYGRKLKSSLLLSLIIFPFIWLYLFSATNLFNFPTPRLNNFQKMGTLFFQLVGFTLLSFSYLSIRTLSGVSRKQSDTEEKYLILFICPNNRQAMFAAKIVALASHYFLINLMGLTLPALLFLVINTNLSFWSLLSFALLHGLVFSLVFFLSVLGLFYFFSHYSLKNQLLAGLYLALILMANLITIILVPLLTPLVFLASSSAGIYLCWLYWKNFATKDFG